MNLSSVNQALEFGSRHGRGLFTEATDPRVWKAMKTSPFYGPMINEARMKAEQLLNEPLEALPFSKYRIFDETGSRKEYELAYFRRRLHLNTFAIMAMADDDPKYLQALEDTIWTLCDDYTWCLPAHLYGNSLKPIEQLNLDHVGQDKISAHFREHRHMVDLFAAETGFALAEIVHLLGDRLADLIVYRARKEIKERVLDSFTDLNHMFHWETVTHNWAAVCAGSIGAAAMYIIEDNRVLAPLIHRLLDIVESYLSGFGMDGACTEGLGYWGYGFGFFTYFAALLEQRTAGRIDLFASPKVQQIALFQQKCFLNENYVVSFSDSSLQSSPNLGLTHFLKTKFSELSVPDARYRAPYASDHCFRWASTVRSFIWAKPEYGSMPQQDEAYYLEDAQWMISRKVTPDGAVSIAAKGGHNQEPHNHNDVGNFIYHINGETLLTDTGAGEYTKQYFRDQRYTFICNRSMGHSVPIVEGCEQKAGAEYRAEILSRTLNGDTDELVMNIAAAYPNDNLQTLERSFRFQKAGKPILELQDTYRFHTPPSSITERFVSFHKPYLVEPGVVRVQGKNHFVDIAFHAEKLEFGWQRVDFVNHYSVVIDLYLIDFTFVSPSSEETVVFWFEGSAL